MLPRDKKDFVEITSSLLWTLQQTLWIISHHGRTMEGEQAALQNSFFVLHDNTFFLLKL